MWITPEQDEPVKTLQTKISHSLTSLLFMLAFLVFPMSQCLAVGESLVPQHRSYKSFSSFSVILAGEGGRFIVAGPQSHDLSAKNMPAIGVINANHELGNMVAIKLPARASKLISVRIEKGRRLSNGDILLVGYVRAVRGKQLFGWAARLNPNLKTLWSKVWSQRETRNERFYFGVEAQGNEIWLGGKSAQGRGCTDGSKGVLLLINGVNGKLKGGGNFMAAQRSAKGFEMRSL